MMESMRLLAAPWLLATAGSLEASKVQYVELSPGQVALAVGLVVLSGAVSLALRLGLERRLALASIRTVVQLLLIGVVLRWVFRWSNVYIVLGIMLVMTVIAGLAAVRRTERRWQGIWFDSVLAIWASSWLIAALALMAIVRVEPWYQPQYAIPLLGMILGNTLSGISLGLDRLGDELSSHRDEVETLLSLGATRWEAAIGPMRKAIRTGMLPTINTMMVVGLVSLPGMMTGQLVAGMDAMQAVMYQIVIMFLIAAGTALGTVGVVLFGYRRLFTADHRFDPQWRRIKN
ncbi:MAG: ABC transporter permease [Planctomycetota bacterium]